MITMLKQGKDYITDSHGIYTEYVCSNAADVANLPTGANSEADVANLPTGANSEAEDKPRPGSTAVVPSTDGGAASVYVLSNERTWVLLIEG